MPDMQRTDAEVAERVMGWKWVQRPVLDDNFLVPPDEAAKHLPEYVGKNPEWPDADPPRFLPHYTTDASAAEQVVVAMIDRGWSYRLDGFRTTDDLYFWEVEFAGFSTSYQSEGTGPTAAPFICRCAMDADKATTEPPEES